MPCAADRPFSTWFRSRSAPQPGATPGRARRFGLHRLCCLSAALVCQATAHADSLSELGAMSLDSLLDVEVSAVSKFSQRIGESASSASVVTASEIRALGYRTLAEALASVRGLSAGSDRTYAFLGVRGLAAPGDYNTRVLLLIDGVRVNDSVYDQALLGSEFPLDLDVVERIEFIPGQGSAVHGANALFGVVNVVTRKIAGHDQARGWVSAGTGRAGSASAMLNLAGSEGRGLLLSATASHSEGRDLYFPGFDTPQTNHGLSSGTDGERSHKLLLKLDAGNGLSGSLIHAERVKGIPAMAGTIFGDPGNQYRDSNSLASLVLDRALDSATDWKTRLYAGEYRFEGDYVIDYAPGAINVDKARALWWGLESSWVTTRFAGHKLAVGADLQRSPHRDQRNFDATDPATVHLDDHGEGQRISFFAEDQFELSPGLALTAGARWDHARADGLADNALSPRFAAVYRPDQHTVLKYIYGAAFRPPNAYETRYAVPGTPAYKGNSALRNESVQGHEIALELRPDASTRWLASIYTNRARDLIVQTTDAGDGSLMFRNQGSLRSYGLELEAELLMVDGTRLRANYANQYVDRPDGASAGNAAPRQLANVIAIVPLGLRGTLGLHGALASRRGAAAGYATLDLTLASSAPWRGWEASLSLHNLFDRQAEDPGSDPQSIPTVPRDGRSLRLLLEYGF